MSTPFIIVDTREQLPYWKSSEAARMALVVGDYTTARLLGKFHIERKSAMDLYGTLTKGNVRFKKEIWRAWERGIRFAIYVECTKEQFVTKQFPRGQILKFPEEGLRRMIRTFEGERFELEFVWHCNRAACRAAVVRRLVKEEKKLNEKRI